MISVNFNDKTNGATFMGASSCEDSRLTHCGQVTSYGVMKHVQQSNNGSSNDLSPVGTKSSV